MSDILKELKDDTQSAAVEDYLSLNDGIIHIILNTVISYSEHAVCGVGEDLVSVVVCYFLDVVLQQFSVLANGQ